MNSDTVRPTPPRRFNRRRKEISVTPAMGDSTSGGLISISRILKGLTNIQTTILTAQLELRPPLVLCGFSFAPLRAKVSRDPRYNRLRLMLKSGAKIQP